MRCRLPSTSSASHPSSSLSVLWPGVCSRASALVGGAAARPLSGVRHDARPGTMAVAHVRPTRLGRRVSGGGLLPRQGNGLGNLRRAPPLPCLPPEPSPPLSLLPPLAARRRPLPPRRRRPLLSRRRPPRRRLHHLLLLGSCPVPGDLFCRRPANRAAADSADTPAEVATGPRPRLTGTGGVS